MPNIPEGATVPQDRKTKTDDPSYEEVQIDVPNGVDDDGNPKTRKVPAKRVTVDGLTIDIQDRAASDYRVARLMSKARKGDGLAGVEVLDIMLGEQQHEAVAAKYTDDDGFVDSEKVAEFTVSMFEALNPNS